MKKSKLGQDLIAAMNEALAHRRGEITLRTTEVELPDQPPIWTKEAIARLRRDKLKVSQPIFASYLGISPGALKSWEQGSKKPSGAARRLLQVVANNPKAFFEAVKTDSHPRKKAG